MAEQHEFPGRDGIPVLRDRVLDIGRVPVVQVDEFGDPVALGGGGGGGGDASLAQQVIQTAHLAAIETAVEGTLDVAVLSVPAPLNVVGGGLQATALRVTLASDSTGVVAITGTLPLPTGSATLAEQQVQTTHLAAIETAVEGTLAVGVATVPAPLNVVGGGLQATALRVTVASDSTGQVAITAGSLPLPTGAATETTLAAAAASLSVVDDWDEADRAKVNAIVGSAGVDGGSGVVSAATQRVVLATNVGLPAGANALGSVTITGNVSCNTELPNAAALADATANPSTSLIGACLEAFNGTTWDRMLSGTGTSTRALRGVAASDSPDVVALQIIDDWDESDRAKVNPIAGQAGVQGASGTATALTQRVVLATDVGLPAGTAFLGVVEMRPSVDQVYYSGVAKTVLTAFVNATASGNTSTVAAPGASTKIVVLDTFLVNQGTAVVAVKFQSATTDKTPTIDLAADGGGGKAYLQFECGTNEALNVNLGAAGTVGVMVRYITAAA